MKLWVAVLLLVLATNGFAARYVALVTQSFTDDPIVMVLENDIGNIAWHRQGIGDYRGTLTGAFPQGRAVAFVGRESAYNVGFYSLNRFSDDVIQLNTSGLTWNGKELLIEPIDTMLIETPIMITVYPKKTR